MISFGNLVKAFSDWRKTSDIADSQVSNYKYIWEIPQDALNTWKEFLNQYADKLTTEELTNYKSMFAVGKQMTGIYIGATSPDTYARLYKLTEYTWDFTIPDILCSANYDITSNAPYSNTAVFPSGQRFELPLLIKPRSVVFSTVFDGYDTPMDETFGIISGKDFANKIRNHNRRGQESIYGFINYKTGNIHLVRSNLKNETKFEQYYDKLLKLLAAANSSSSDSAQSSDSSSSSQAFTEPPPPPYDYADIAGRLTIIAPPITTVLEVDTEGDPQ